MQTNGDTRAAAVIIYWKIIRLRTDGEMEKIEIIRRQFWPHTILSIQNFSFIKTGPDHVSRRVAN